jgi:hypothetical protein
MIVAESIFVYGIKQRLPMSEMTTEHYAEYLLQLCLPPLALQEDKNPILTTNDTNDIVKKWLDAPGWPEDIPDKERGDLLVRFVKHLCTLHSERVPIEWLWFPLNAAQNLLDQSKERSCDDCRQRDVLCATALENYALALKDASRAHNLTPLLSIM